MIADEVCVGCIYATWHTECKVFYKCLLGENVYFEYNDDKQLVCQKKTVRSTEE